jgi:predicted nucleic acid-binding protein
MNCKYSGIGKVAKEDAAWSKRKKMMLSTIKIAPNSKTANDIHNEVQSVMGHTDV